MVQAKPLPVQHGESCQGIRSGKVRCCTGAETSVTKTLVQAAADQLTAISRSVETYRSELNKLASQLPEYSVVMEMYGVGESLGPQLMAEIGDVRRFERKQSLVAFAGIDPAPSESGNYCSRSNRTTKRGSPISAQNAVSTL